MCPLKFFNFCVQNTKNLILMNYKIKKKKPITYTNKNHHTTKIITHFILLKIRKQNDHK